VTELLTERLRLRPWRDDDLEPYVAINADPEVTRYLSRSGAPLTREETETGVARITAHWKEHGYGLFAVDDLAADRLIGFVGLSHHRAMPEEVEIGWRLHRDFWGRGLATEGATAALRYGFDILGLPRIISIALPENVASRRVMEKIGMAFWVEIAFEDVALRVFAVEP